MARAVAGETKRDAFRRLAEARTNAVLEKLRILGNCANPYAYQWTDGDVEEIFEAITREVRSAQLRFELHIGSRGPFKLVATRLQSEPPIGDAESVALTGLTSAGDLQTEPDGPPADSSRQPAHHLAAPPPADPDAFEIRPVQGREKSQVAVGHKSGRGWRAVAKDKGHRKGYQLLLFAPTSDEAAEVVNTGPGCLRAGAIEAAKALIREREVGPNGIH